MPCLSFQSSSKSTSAMDVHPWPLAHGHRLEADFLQPKSVVSHGAHPTQSKGIPPPVVPESSLPTSAPPAAGAGSCLQVIGRTATCWMPRVCRSSGVASEGENRMEVRWLAAASISWNRACCYDDCFAVNLVPAGLKLKCHSWVHL